MRVIDFHQHAGLDLERHLSVLDELNISKAVVMPYSFGDLTEKEAYHLTFSKEKGKRYINGFLKKLDRINDELFYQIKGVNKMVFTPWLSPECDNLDSFLNALVVKFVPIFDNFTSDYFDRIKPLVNEAISNGSMIMIHTGWGAPVKPIGDLAAEFPDGKFIIAHMKEDDDSYAVDRLNVLKNYKNVFCEISYFPHPKRISQYVSNGLVNQLLFGSDFRKLADKQTIKGFRAMLMQADISDADKERILYFNAEQLL